jgi:phosphatidylinositol glycan class M
MFFYQIYLSFSEVSPIKSILAFIPQVAILAVAGYKLYKDLPFCIFIQTFVFVTFNKVVTAQYFLWYIVYIPIVLSRSQLWLDVSQRWKLYVGGAIWVGVEIIWCVLANLLEGQGQSVFLELWLAAVAFFMVNVVLIILFVKAHQFKEIVPIKHD